MVLASALQATTVTLASVANNARMTAPAMGFATMVNASVILHGMEMTARFLSVAKVK